MKYLLLVLLSCILVSCENSTLNPADDQVADYETLKAIRLSYGSDSLQFGDLYMPEEKGQVPVIMIIHGGCWLSSYDLSLMDSMALDLAKRGYATWNIEYRRTADPGGGWPGTFIDVGLALKHLEEIATSYPLNLQNLVITGHSAGGHLALFLGAQNKLMSASELKVEGIPGIKGIVSLAGIIDLSTYYRPSGCGGNVPNLIGGLPQDRPERYAEGSPISHLPLGVPQILVQGESDFIVPLSHVTPYYELAKDNGENISLVTIPSVGHFELIAPGSTAWDEVLSAFEMLLR